MGQDREFSLEQKTFALSAIHKFRTYWENFEEEKLLADRDALLDERKEDETNFSEEVVTAYKEKEETLINNYLNPPQPTEEELKALEEKKAQEAKDAESKSKGGEE